MAERLLIVEDETTLRDSLHRVFTREGYEVSSVEDAETALELARETPFDLIITDIILPGMNGIEFLRQSREANSDQIVIVMTAFASLETAVNALRGGAYDYVIKPVIHEEIKRVVRKSLEERRLRVENQMLRKQVAQRYDFTHIIGKSRALNDLINQVKKVADSRSNVLIEGETGTGKELFARAIHFSSSRREQPFVPINCSAIPDTLLESELFGYMRGAFTGAVTAKRGLFQEADGGTLFLDEIGELSATIQAKLLRVIDDREVRPLGGVQSRKVDVRIVAATNRDLRNAVRDAKFREDLFYRINVINLKVPSLRERKDDIPMLAMHFVQKYSQELGKKATGIDSEAVKTLQEYNWAGNVRELQNIIERAVLLCDEANVQSEHLPDFFRKSDTFLGEALNNSLSIDEYTKEFIRKYEGILKEQKIADLLGITRKSLWEKRKKWNLPRNKSDMPDKSKTS